MDSGPTLKPKVTVKLNYDNSSPARPVAQTHIPSRPASPVKSYASSNAVDATFRPKAKVNSSATTRKVGTSSSTTSGSTSTTPRAGSPTKLTPRVKKAVVSPTSRSTLRSPTPVGSPPATPDLRKKATLRTDDSRPRTASVSLHHAASFSSFHPSSSSVVSSGSGSVSATASPRLMPSKSVLGLSERGQTSSPTLRIRSKVSNLAKAAAESSPTASSPGSSVSPPLFPSARLANPPRTRAPSTSSAVGQQQSQQQLSPPPPTSPPPQFYPITTAVPAANPHRFASNRPPAARTSPPTAHHVFQSFSQPSSATLHSDQGSSSSSSRPRSASAFLNLNGTGTATAKVDPASIPLPPHSPPASAVSFSSRSSVSRSSASVSYLGPATGTESPSTDGGSQRGASVKQQQQQQQSTPDNLRATLDNLMQYTSGLADDDEGDSGHDRETDGELVGAEEHKVKAAAKSNRKIADLEITNRSLLAINASLEATKHRQAKEIHELRRKLRESRLILPPRAYRDVKSSLGPAELEDDEEDVDDDDEEEEAEGGGGEGVDGDESGKAAKGKGKGDEIYKRVKVMLDALLKTGQAALERQVKDFPEGGRGAAKVLSPEELKDWRGTNGIEQDNEHEHEHEHDEHDTALDNNGGLEPESRTQEGLEAHGQEGDYGHIHIPRNDKDEEKDEGDHDVGNDTITSEDEVEAMTIPAFSPPSSPPPPPILITQPS